MSINLRDDDPKVNSFPADSRPDPSMTAFRELLIATGRGDLRSARAATKHLRSLGWSVVPIAPRAGEGR